MASIRREIDLEAPPDKVWDAVRDVGAIHQRLAPGFVTNVRLEPGARVVTFGNGMVVRELIGPEGRTPHIVGSYADRESDLKMVAYLSSPPAG